MQGYSTLNVEWCRTPWESLECDTKTVVLTSGEAELGGMCRGASAGSGLQSIAHDLGIDSEFEVLTDATTAIGICRRRGLGRIRNIHTADL